jgi:hypothetical protein
MIVITMIIVSYRITTMSQCVVMRCFHHFLMKSALTLELLHNSFKHQFVKNKTEKLLSPLSSFGNKESVKKNDSQPKVLSPYFL